MELQTLIIESIRAEEAAQRLEARDREAKAYLFHRDIHTSIADALGNLASTIERAVAAAYAAEDSAEA